MRLNYLFLGLIAFSLLLLTENNACAAEDKGADRVTILEENDAFASMDDRHYTQGILVSRLGAAIESGDDWNAPFAWLAGNTPLFESGNYHRRYDWSLLGQSIFTPQNIHTTNPPATDRPYGAWLYTGASLLQETKHETHNTLENTELLVGVVGPFALGSLVQNDWHQFIGVRPAEGWRNQIHNEPGLALSYERKWRFGMPLGDYLGADIIPEMGATVGNVFTYGQTGGFIRLGHNLAADYGPRRIRPSLSGTGWFDPDGMKDDLGWYFYAGAQGRAVGHNIFLDGNTMRSSPSVDKKELVADFVAGAAVFWTSAVRLDITVTERTKEFYGQGGHPDHFGSIGLTVNF